MTPEEKKLYDELHKKMVWAYLGSEAFKTSHPRKWKEFQKEDKIKNAVMPTPEEFQIYGALTKQILLEKGGVS